MVKPLEMVVQPGRRVLQDLWANRRTAATFLIMIALWSLTSAFIFWVVERDSWRLAHELDNSVVVLTFGRAVYFTAMNVTTVGFGDIVPRTGLGEVIAVANALAGLIMFGFLVGAVTAALQPGSEEPALSQTHEEPGRRSEGERSDSVDKIADALARLLTEFRPGVVGQDDFELVMEVTRARGTTTIHVIVGSDRRRLG